jgi:hypothetical protein
MSKLGRILMAGAAAVILGSGFSASAFANTWQANHPRRAEVNHRLAHQDHRINHEFRTGQISRGRAMYLHHEDREIRGEERAMARMDGGHITGADQRALNQQENYVSRQIGY